MGVRRLLQGGNPQCFDHAAAALQCSAGLLHGETEGLVAFQRRLLPYLWLDGHDSLQHRQPFVLCLQWKVLAYFDAIGPNRHCYCFSHGGLGLVEMPQLHVLLVRGWRMHLRFDVVWARVSENPRGVAHRKPSRHGTRILEPNVLDERHL